MKRIYENCVRFVSLKIISPFKWDRIRFLITGRFYNLMAEDREYARRYMNLGVYIWVSRRKSHLTSYLISISDWILSLCVWLKSGRKGTRPKFGYWSHAFWNVGPVKLVEAIAIGVKENYFDDVFDCDGVACLVPAFIPEEEWKDIADELEAEIKLQEGKQYDAMFRPDDEAQVSCIELIRLVLKKRVKDYELKFKDFETMIKLYGNLTPQMLYDCKSFKVVWEVRR